MTGQFTLYNYMENKPLDSHPVVVSDGGSDYDMVCIATENNVVKVDGKEMIKAIQSLMRINYPYI